MSIKFLLIAAAVIVFILAAVAVPGRLMPAGLALFAAADLF